VVVAALAAEANAAVLAVRDGRAVAAVELDELNGVARRAAAAVAHRDIALDLDDRDLREELLRIAAVAVLRLNLRRERRGEGEFESVSRECEVWGCET
jgi:hypothetical protein